MTINGTVVVERDNFTDIISVKSFGYRKNAELYVEAIMKNKYKSIEIKDIKDIKSPGLYHIITEDLYESKLYQAREEIVKGYIYNSSDISTTLLKVYNVVDTCYPSSIIFEGFERRVMYDDLKDEIEDETEVENTIES